MQCDICHQNPAIIHIQEIGPNGQHSLNLCLKCAFTRMSSNKESLPDFDSFVKNMLDNQLVKQTLEHQGISQDDLQKFFGSDPVKACPHCGATWSEIQRTQCLGCEQCLEAFKDQLDDELVMPYREIWKEMDSTPQDVQEVSAKRTRSRKTPRKLDLQKEVARLQRELDCAVKSENYARAAKLRDMIAEFQLDTPKAESKA